MKKVMMILALILGMTTELKAKDLIALVGDSTVATYSSGKQGWGAKLSSYMNKDVATTKNFAKGGRSSKSFYKEGHWKEVLKSKAKYVYIQFGHNDDASESNRKTTITEFKSYLTKYVNEARAKNMMPILVTPLRRVKFSGGKSVSNLEHRSEAMKEVAKSLAVDLIDLHQMSGAQYNSWGEKTTLTYFAKDDRTHPNEKGAAVFAKLVANKTVEVAPEMQNIFNK